ncbi:MAG: PHP domain-containing protein [Chitinivibrionales bacterium]|nr:PHP domain-containing protein [Chitinivibrionales bacterium]
MLEVDLHAHSHFSLCGLHSIMEMLAGARDRGMAALAVTDHGPTLGGRVSTTFFDRLIDPVPGVRLLKGMECNLAGDQGDIDLPSRVAPYCDVVLLGVHPNTPSGLSPSAYTDMLVRALERNPIVDMVTHPNSTEYPLELDRLAHEAARLNVALELNNSKTALRRVADSVTEELLAACSREGCSIVVCSDAHALNEVGNDEAVRPLLQRLSFPEELIVNRTAESAFAWIESRRGTKPAA